MTTSLGLTINVKKTEVMFQPIPNHPAAEPDITLNGSRLNSVNHFTYLGSTVSSTNSLDKEIEKRISAAAAAYGKLQSRVWQRTGIRQQTKCKVYRAVVLSSLLYSSETYILYRRHIRQLQRTQMSHLRHLLKIRWQDRVSDVEVRKRAGMPSVEALLTQGQLRWAGHVVRMDEGRLPRKVFYGELQEGKRGVGRPKLRYKDCLKRHLKAGNIRIESWEETAADRTMWRTSIKRAAKLVEDRLEEETVERSRRRAARSANAPLLQPALNSLTCPSCGRVCHHRIGLHSHMRSCQRSHTLTE